MIPAPRDLVLVVDDDPDIVRFVQVNLEVEGFDVIGARNGFDALLKVSVVPPHPEWPDPLTAPYVEFVP